MKRSFFAAIFFITFITGFAQTELDRIRQDFWTINGDSCNAEALFESVKRDSYNSALLQAYAGSLEAAAAQCVKGAFTKLEYFSRGKKNLEAAIEREPQNPEIRFLRFVTQANAPNFLEYDNIREDKINILEKLPDYLQVSNRQFWDRAIQFMMDSGKLSQEEEIQLQQLLTKE